MMVSASNVTVDTTIYVEEYTLITSLAILLAEIVIGSIGNVIICYVVHKNKSLRTPINALVVNVSVCGIVESIVSTPLLLAILLSGPNFYEAVHIGQKFIHIMCSTVQLISIIAISYERHQAIARPFDKLERVKRAKISIPLSWLFGLLSGFIANFVFREYLLHNLTRKEPVKSVHKSFEAIILVPLSLGSVVAVACLYVIIIHLVQKHINQKNSKFKKAKNKVSPTGKSTVVVDLPSQSVATTMADSRTTTSYTPGKDFLQVPKPQKVNDKTDKQEVDFKTSQQVMLNTNNSNKDTDSTKVAQGKRALEATGSNEGIQESQGTVQTQSTVQTCAHVVDVYSMDGSKTQHTTTNDAVSGAICVMNPANKERGKRRVEAKTAKVTAIVIGAFLFCWTPYPLSVLVVYFTSPEHINTKLNIYMICLSLSIIAAALNPIFYGLINKGIRLEVNKQYKKLKQYLRTRFCNKTKS